MRLEKSSPKIYMNNKAKNHVEVIDRNKREIVASGPVTKSKTNVAMALDEANHRLFIACRAGDIVVFDATSGKELTALPITKGEIGRASCRERVNGSEVAVSLGEKGTFFGSTYSSVCDNA